MCTGRGTERTRAQAYDCRGFTRTPGKTIFAVLVLPATFAFLSAGVPATVTAITAIGFANGTALRSRYERNHPARAYTRQRGCWETISRERWRIRSDDRTFRERRLFSRGACTKTCILPDGTASGGRNSGTTTKICARARLFRRP